MWALGFGVAPLHVARVTTASCEATDGVGATVMVVVAVAIQPVVSVQVAEYVVVASGETSRVAPVVPVDQITVPAQPDRLRIVDAPTHMVALLTDNTGVGFTVTVVDVTAEQPKALVTVTL